MRIVTPVGLVFWVALPLAGQTASASPGFEVASIRPNPGPWHVLSGFSSSGSRLTLEGWTAADLIAEAYGLKYYQVRLSASVQQSEAYGTYYNISAKAEGNGQPTRAEFRPMLQKLLAERFNLKLHREMKETPVYALVVGKGGPKFKPSAPDAVPSAHHSVNGRRQYFTLVKATMDSVADNIRSGFGPDRPVVDRTGLTGVYDVRLEATPEFRANRDPDPSDLSVFIAVQEQLGLKLEPQKAQIEILVLDHIERPSAN